MGRTLRTRQRQKKTNEGQPKEDDVKDIISDFHKEMKSNGWLNSTKLSLRHFADTGRGLCSKTQSFQKDDILIQLPIKTMITIRTLEEDEGFKDLFDLQKADKDTHLSLQMLLALYVLYQKHLEQESRFYFYTKMLPSKFTTPLFMSSSELYHIPESFLLEIVEANRKIKQQHQLIFKIMKNDLCLCCGRKFQNDLFSLAEVKWAFYVVNTRSVYIDSLSFKPKESFFKAFTKDSTNSALAPFLDLFNHSSQVQTKADLVFNEATSQWDYSIRLLNSSQNLVLPRSQIFINYGNLANKKLLMEYGFFIKNNPNDYFEVNLLDIERFLKEEKTFVDLFVDRKKFKFIRDHNLDDALFLHPSDGISHNLHVVFHLIFKEESHFPNVLNRIAFGSASNLENIYQEILLFILYQKKLYEIFHERLTKQSSLTPSALVFKDYLKESLSLLDKCKNLIDLESEQ